MMVLGAQPVRLAAQALAVSVIVAASSLGASGVAIADCTSAGQCNALPSGGDGAFLARLAQAGMTPRSDAGAQGLVQIGKQICVELQYGASNASVVAEVESNAPSESHQQVVALVNAAHDTYCPLWH
ncbi:DUF732 domain-containing protein [Mycolicibacterium sp. CBMA 226]|uniref:DUF732 domain-containing protein n=1 Tax=Mycolicibacterium sp. CBMA 226 TaxID=2606611 RepID=UPI0012DBD397|nr:DUF732 domain-containing protein [Mycolicibacterium sp. CBMA 226]MUL76443.1 DUF732 domain-containing protein [Mycolicibacterium sp. CBMA 226]